MLTTGNTKLHTFGILLADRQVASCPKPLNIAVVVRIAISRTYDNTMNNVVLLLLLIHTFSVLSLQLKKLR